MATPPLQYRIGDAEAAQLASLIDTVARDEPPPSNADFYDQGWRLRPLVPDGLRKFLDDVQRTEPTAAVIINGFPADGEPIEPTPGHWQDAVPTAATKRHDIFLGLVAMSLGEPFSWSTLQSGRLIGNVLPIKGDENQQSGHGSETLLEWHTEDAFHPHRCDYLLLMGVRNQDRIPTTLSSVRDVRLEAAHTDILAQRRYFILPDDEHLRQMAASHPDHRGLENMRRMRAEPEPVAVLYGDIGTPYLRIDPFFMRCADPADSAARAALDTIVAELKRVQMDVVVEAGSVLIIDNYLAVHGRRAFAARYDGTDRWLKKAIVTRDLRRSRGDRVSASGRVLF